MGKKVIFLKLTNRQWVSEVCTLINNDIRHQSCQNVVDSRGAETLVAKSRLVSVWTLIG